MSDVVMFRLDNGDEVVADRVSKNECSTVIRDAVALVYHQTDKGVSVGFAPFMPQSDGDITLWHGGISAVATPNPQVLKEYTRIFSKIEIAPAGSIVV
jgi:hypothetical protein